MPPKKRNNPYISPGHNLPSLQQPTKTTKNSSRTRRRGNTNNNPRKTKSRTETTSNMFTETKYETFGSKGREFDDVLVDSICIHDLLNSEDSSSEEYPQALSGEAYVGGSRISNPRKPVWSHNGTKLTEEELVKMVEGETAKELSKSWTKGPQSTAGIQPEDPRFYCQSGIKRQLEACQKRLVNGLPLKGSYAAERLVHLLIRQNSDVSEYNEDMKYYKRDLQFAPTTDKEKNRKGYTVTKDVGQVPTPEGLHRLMIDTKRARNLYQKTIESPTIRSVENNNTNHKTITTSMSNQFQPQRKSQELEETTGDLSDMFGFF